MKLFSFGKALIVLLSVGLSASAPIPQGPNAPPPNPNPNPNPDPNPNPNPDPNSTPGLDTGAVTQAFTQMGIALNGISSAINAGDSVGVWNAVQQAMLAVPGMANAVKMVDNSALVSAQNSRDRVNQALTAIGVQRTQNFTELYVLLLTEMWYNTGDFVLLKDRFQQLSQAFAANKSQLSVLANFSGATSGGSPLQL